MSDRQVYTPDLAGLDANSYPEVVSVLRRNLEMIGTMINSKGGVSLSSLSSSSSTGTVAPNLWEKVIVDGEEIIRPKVTYDSVSADAVSLNPLLMVDAPAQEAGRMWYNSERQVMQIYSDIANSMLDVGEENRERCRNDSHATIPDARVVYVSGATSWRPTIALATNNDETIAGRILGVTTNSSEHGEDVYVVLNGTVHDIDTHLWPEGTLLYLDGTGAGTFTSTPPVAPNAIICCGLVTRQNATNGSICVNPKRIYELPFSSIDKNRSGFDDPTLVTQNYNPLTRIVTTTGTGKLYWQGRLVHDLAVSALTSVAHGTDAGQWFYYYNGSAYIWSQIPWTFDQAQIATTTYDAVTPALSYGLRECHSLMDRFSHEEFHNRIGTYRKSGGVIGNYTAYSTTLRRPSIASSVLVDEDLPTTVPSWTGTPYTTAYLSGALATFTLARTQDDIGPLVNQARWNEWNGTTWGISSVPNGKFVNYWVLAMPVMADAYSQAVRYSWMMGQSIHDTLASARAETPATLSYGTLGSLATEDVIIGKAIVAQSGANWSIAETYVVDVSKSGFGSASGTMGLTTVSHDATLTGNGTVALPLGVEPSILSQSYPLALGTSWTIDHTLSSTVPAVTVIDSSGQDIELEVVYDQVTSKRIHLYAGHSLSGTLFLS